MLLCGHYEGIDERVIEELEPEEISDMWSDKIRHHLTSLHASIWDIVEFGAQEPSVGDEGYDSDEVAQIWHFNS